MRKTIVIIISLLFIIGVASQASAVRKIQCWDLNENYECDIATEDINNDGRCNPQDCVTEEPIDIIVQKTGQTTCYDVDGSVINDCTGTGQDGEYQIGVICPDPRFTDNEDGTVTDNCTGLIWLKSATCLGRGTWAYALSSANGLESGSCGLTDGSEAGDWHLPNVRELFSLIDFETGDVPADAPFNHAALGYWTSTTVRWGDAPKQAAYVVRWDGSVRGSDKVFDFNVWAVRNPK